MNTLMSKQLYLLDMDGTIYHEDTLIPGSLDFFNCLERQGKKYCFMTNNSSKGKKSYLKKLNQLGINALENNIVSSVDVTIEYLNKWKRGSKIYLVGTHSFQEELEENGYKVVPINYRRLDIDIVLVGFDTELSYAKIEGACYYISRGFKYIATNCDLRCPVKDNKFIPDCGAICCLIEYATNIKPLFMGKPSRAIVGIASRLWSISFENIICVGDRLYTDIAVGINAGVSTALVLTGEAKKEDIITTPFKPTFCFESINDLYIAIK